MHGRYREFRDCLGCFATGIAIAATQCTTGKNVGITINSFSSLSLDPALILFSLDKMAMSYNSFIQSEFFTINILSSDQESLSRQFAVSTGNKWHNISISAAAYAKNCPLIDGAIAYLECSKEMVYEGGDHSIIIGKVLHFHKASDNPPLLYWKGSYQNLKQE